jgi:hypothetical protein
MVEASGETIACMHQTPQTETRHGFPVTQWQSGVDEAVAILSERASREDPITYSELAARLRTVTIGYHSQAMDDLLVDVSTQEHEAGRPLLSVMVVHKYGDQEPGNGFYTLAEWLGFKFSDRQAFWIAEFNRVTEYWRRNYRNAS